MRYRVRLRREPQGWIARVEGLLGVLGVGATREEALAAAREQAHSAIQDQLDQDPTDASLVLLPAEWPDAHHSER
jgi:predicted RNase H-like HicB family nuclease